MTHTQRCLVAALALAPLTFGACSSVKKWDKDIKSKPAGVGIQGQAAVQGIVNVLRQHRATPRQAELGLKKAEEVLASLPEAVRERTELIAVPVEPDDRSDPKADASVMIFNVKSRRMEDENVFDLKVDKAAAAEAVRTGAETVQVGRLAVARVSIDRLI